jgi:Protein of unknown function (DUF1585)/Protein of unknown function (DUF1549)
VPRAALAAFALLVTLPLALDARSAAPPPAARTLDDYRHFRVLAIDLLGRMPTRDEIAEFERSDFDVARWIDGHLDSAGYTERLTRIYMDALRLEPNPATQSAGTAQLRRVEVEGPDHKPVWVYYRDNERRTRVETDGEFCLSPDEAGFGVRPGGQIVGTAKMVPQALLDAHTVLVKPWWLYKDYRSPSPSQLYGSTWANPDPQYRPVESLLKDPDGKEVTEIRVCREEAQTEATGHIYVSGRTNAPPKPRAAPPAPPATGKDPKLKEKEKETTAKPGEPRPGEPKPPEKLPGGRLRPPPPDRPYALQHKGEPVACDSRLARDNAVDCGCGVGLERCVPGDSTQNGAAFYFPNHMPLGPEEPLDVARQSGVRWFPYWWSREAVRYFDYLFSQDRDFREVLTGKWTLVNGPLAQYYRTVQRSNCCGPEAGFGMLEEKEPLFSPDAVPRELEPFDVTTWKLVENRGPHAAGLLTTPAFLEKYASARARGAAIYNDFLCKSFIAENQQLTASQEPNLTIRPGCKTCHATLEPLAAYFARVEPGSSVFLPTSNFPVKDPICKLDKNGRMNGNCNALYDIAFVDPHEGATLRSAYASPEHADAGPLGAGEDLAKSPEFAECAVERVASSFLGRQLTADDDALLRSLTGTFTSSGYRMRAMVKAILLSDAYRRANNLSSTTWRGGDR